MNAVIHWAAKSKDTVILGDFMGPHKYMTQDNQLALAQQLAQREADEKHLPWDPFNATFVIQKIN